MEAPGSDAESAPAVETLAPTSGPMPAQPAWAADVEAPALPLEGL